MSLCIPLCVTNNPARQRTAQMPAGPQFVDWRYRKRRDPYDGPVNNPPPDDSEYTRSPENLRYIDQPHMDRLRDPGPGSLGDADGDERIDVPQDDQRELQDHTPETPDVRHQDFVVDITAPDDRPVHGPKRTHNVFDSQQDELMLESPDDNDFTDTYPYAQAIRLSTVGQVRTRLAILHDLYAAALDPDTARLINNYKLGDIDSGQELITRNLNFVNDAVRRRVFRFGRPTISSEEMADLTQEAQLALLEAIQHYDGQEDLDRYLWKNIDGRVANEIRKMQRRHDMEHPVEDQSFVPAEPQQNMRELLPRLLEIVQGAPGQLQPWVPFFVAHFRDGVSYTDLSTQTQKTRRVIQLNIERLVDWLKRTPDVQEMSVVD